MELYSKYLHDYRTKRNFDVVKYVEAKCKLLNDYIQLIDHSCVIVAVSGGIDSAVVLELVVRACADSKSQIKKIIAVSIPEFVDGTTNQYEAFEKALNLVNDIKQKYGDDILNIINFNCVDMTKQHSMMKQSLGFDLNDWTSGQLVSSIRTPALYAIASKYYEMGYPAIVCGTTNFDEGSYIGYFGKSSDGCVDIQLISDIHKSEVIKVAKYLGVTKEIITAIPSGDLYNGMSDEEYFGVSYDFLELYLGYLTQNATLINIKNPVIANWIEKIEKMHQDAAHKYAGNGYAVRLKLYDDLIDYDNNNLSKLLRSKYDPRKFIGFNKTNLSQFVNTTKHTADQNQVTMTKYTYSTEKYYVSSDVGCHTKPSESVYIGANLLMPDEIKHFVAISNTLINANRAVPVGEQRNLAMPRRACSLHRSRRRR